MKVGIDLGGSHVAIGIVNDDCKIIEQYEKDYTDEEKKNILPVVEEYITQEIKKIQKKYEIKKIGMTIPGSVEKGVIKRAVNLGIENYNIGEKLYKKTGIPFIIKNDAKCAAWGEYKRIAEDNEKNILFLTIGTGIGGAYIYKGNLLEGNNFEGCEFGHMIIKENGIKCNCGKNGCYEKYGSILCFKQKIQKRLSLSADISGPDLRKEIAKQEDKVKDIKEEYIFDICLGLSNLINIFEPDIIIIGGGFAHFDYMFIEKIKYKLINSNLLYNKRKDIDIRIAKLGNDAGIIGASYLCEY